MVGLCRVVWFWALIFSIMAIYTNMPTVSSSSGGSKYFAGETYTLFMNRDELVQWIRNRESLSGILEVRESGRAYNRMARGKRR